MEISRSDFDVILTELFESDKVCFDTLCRVTSELLIPTVQYWCNTNPVLRNKNCEDDIVQDTELKVIKYSLTHFFFAGGRETPNRDPEQFNKWLFTVAKNVMRDHVRSFSAKSYQDISDVEHALADDAPTADEERDVCAQLSEVIDAVINLRVGIHKILAWLLISIKILNSDGQRSKITDTVVSRFKDCPLFDMYLEIQREFLLYPDINLNAYQKTRIEKSLLADTDRDGVQVGDLTFGSFFGSSEGKYTVSDWIYKINLSVRRSLS